MWVFLFPLAAVGFAMFGVQKVLKAPAQTNDDDDRRGRNDADGGEAPDQIDIVGKTDSELIEAGVPVVSDLLSWLKDASNRLEILDEPELMKVDSTLSTSDRSTFLRFASKRVQMNLWLSGPTYMGPFPRLVLAEGNREANGIVIERTAVCLEKSINALRKQ